LGILVAVSARRNSKGAEFAAIHAGRDPIPKECQSSSKGAYSPVFTEDGFIRASQMSAWTGGKIQSPREGVAESCGSAQHVLSSIAGRRMIKRYSLGFIARERQVDQFVPLHTFIRAHGGAFRSPFRSPSVFSHLQRRHQEKNGRRTPPMRAYVGVPTGKSGPEAQ